MSGLNAELDFVSKKLVPVYGGSKVLVNYILKTSAPGTKTNEYKVTGEVKGLHTGDDVRLDVCKIESLTSNEDTLMAGVVSQLLSDMFNWG